MPTSSFHYGPPSSRIRVHNPEEQKAAEGAATADKHTQGMSPSDAKEAPPDEQGNEEDVQSHGEMKSPDQSRSGGEEETGDATSPADQAANQSASSEGAHDSGSRDASLHKASEEGEDHGHHVTKTDAAYDKIKRLVDEHEELNNQGNGTDSKLHSVFVDFCFITGHSELQSETRRKSMDMHEWLECLAHLDLLKAPPFRAMIIGERTIGHIESGIIAKQEAADMFAHSRKRGKKTNDRELTFEEFLMAIRRIEQLLEKKLQRQQHKVVARARHKRRASMHVHDLGQTRVQQQQAGAPELRELRKLLIQHRSRVGLGFGMGVVVKARTNNINFHNPFSFRTFSKSLPTPVASLSSM